MSNSCRNTARLKATTIRATHKDGGRHGGTKAMRAATHWQIKLRARDLRLLSGTAGVCNQAGKQAQGTKRLSNAVSRCDARAHAASTSSVA